MDQLWTDFVNSEWHDWRGSGRTEDRLEKPTWVVDFLARWHLLAHSALDPERLKSLKDLRTLLRVAAEALAKGTGLEPARVETLNRILAQGPVVHRLTLAEHAAVLNLVPVTQDWGNVMAQIAADFARTVAEDGPVRIRICVNPDCLWVFYDDTRNRTKRFCDDKMCGNLMKVRRFRARQKAAPSEAQ